MSFGDRLKTALEMAGETRDSLAAELGVSVQAISQVITGSTKAMTAENCAKAARFLHVDFYWLATGAGEPRSLDPVVRLSDDERELVLAFRDLPEKDQRETLAAVMAKAEETRQVVLRALEKWGVKGFVPPEKAAKHLPPPPAPQPPYAGPERGVRDEPVPYERRRGIVMNRESGRADEEAPKKRGNK